MSWKRGLIFGALNRARIICSSRELFLREVSKLRVIFAKNGYTDVFFNKVYQLFEQKNAKKEIKVDGVDCETDFKFILKIPFVGRLSHEFKNKIVKLFFNDLGINITPVFTSVKVSDFFSLKSQTPKLLTSNVVYRFTCLCDTNLTYIGKSKRHLVVRGMEHLDYNKEKPEGEIKTHIKACDICKNCTMDNFEIIKKSRTDQVTKINEALYIKRETPRLNKNLFNSGSFYTLKIYY